MAFRQRESVTQTKNPHGFLREGVRGRVCALETDVATATDHPTRDRLVAIGDFALYANRLCPSSDIVVVIPADDEVEHSKAHRVGFDGRVRRAREVFLLEVATHRGIWTIPMTRRKRVGRIGRVGELRGWCGAGVYHNDDEGRLQTDAMPLHFFAIDTFTRKYDSLFLLVWVAGERDGLGQKKPAPFRERV